MKALLAILVGFATLCLTALLMSSTGASPAESMIAAAVVSLVLLLSAEMIPTAALLSACGRIGKNIKKNCDIPVQAGTIDRLVVINKDDYLSHAVDALTGAVTSIVLKSGAIAYEIDGQNNSIEPDANMVESGFNNMFDHEVMAKGFDISPTTKKTLNDAKDGRFICICENYYRGQNGNAAFEIYGLTTGLEMTELGRNPNSEETQGAFHMKFFTKKNKEPKLPATLFNTDYATTKGIVDGLLA